MGYTIDIDTGGTFTDCFVQRDGEVRTVKVPTTPHDLTVCFLESIRAGARAFDVSVEDLLFDTRIVRFSNTIGTNTIIQRDGAKVGLLVSRGSEDLAPVHDAHGRAPLVAPDMVAGIDEVVDAAGDRVREPAPDAVLATAQALIDRGARCLVVALANAECNAANEQQVRAIIKGEYPRDYLGSVPVFLSSDLTPRPGYRRRINTAVLNAYIHARLARLLYKAGEDLRRLHYPRTLFIGHNTGTVARVAKTRAINTYNSGPAAGLLGAREIGRLFGAAHIITTDMGGTSFDIGCVNDGQASFALEPDVEGFGCNLPMLAIRAYGAGGGSLARVHDGALAVGPQSAGAAPGPACFGLGGTEPTLTDANLVLGLLDPEFFLGGGMRLDPKRARAAIETHVAAPLGLGVEAAAHRIRDAVEEAMGREVAAVRASLPPGAAALMIAYGGAGALHACAIAAHAGIERIVITPYSAVSSAFGSSLLDAGHLYYRQLEVPLANGVTRACLGEAVAAMRREAARDMRGEGFDAAEVCYEVQLFVRAGADGEELIVGAGAGVADEPGALPAVTAHAADRLGCATEALVLSTVGLLANAAVPHFVPVETARANTGVDVACKGVRPVSLAAHRAPREVAVYARERLAHGHALAGPAILESTQTTLFVPHGWRLEIDAYDHAVLERA